MPGVLAAAAAGLVERRAVGLPAALKVDAKSVGLSPAGAFGVLTGAAAAGELVFGAGAMMGAVGIAGDLTFMQT